MDTAAVIYNTVALVFSLAAIIISVISALRQTSDVRRSNLMVYMTEKGEFYRSKDYRKARDCIITDLPRFDPVVAGVYGLPEPVIDCVLLVGGFYQDIGALVVTEVVGKNVAAALYYTGIKEMWHALEPYVRGERELRSAKELGGFWGSFEYLAAYVNSVSHDEVRRRLLRRRFYARESGLAQPGNQADETPPAVAGHPDPQGGSALASAYPARKARLLPRAEQRRAREESTAEPRPPRI
jgi:hypothetical protein